MKHRIIEEAQNEGISHSLSGDSRRSEIENSDYNHNHKPVVNIIGIDIRENSLMRKDSGANSLGSTWDIKAQLDGKLNNPKNLSKHNSKMDNSNKFYACPL